MKVGRVIGMVRQSSVPGLIRLKLGACRTGPTKRLAADLHAAARLCNVARNAMSRAWLRWREDHPGWQAPPALNDDGTPKLTRGGAPVPVCPAYPLFVTRAGEPGEFRQYEVPGRRRKEWRRADGTRGVSFSTYLYHAGRAAAPALSPELVSMCSREVVARLRAAMPYNHEGEARQRWQAVLWHEANLDTSRSLSIPVPNNKAAVCYAGEWGGRPSALARAARDRLGLFGASGCAAAFPLFAATAGRAWPAPVASLVVRPHTPGNRAVVRRVARGEWPMADSKLAYDERRGWSLHLSYRRPGESLPESGSPGVATLAAEAEGDYPFTVSGASEKPWRVGHGPLLARVFNRLDRRRRDMREDYGTAGPGRRGHGRSRNERDIRPVTRQVQHLVNRVQAQAAAEVVRYCERYQCGTLVWREPHIARRGSLWFAKNKVQWNWTGFGQRLEHQCQRAGIRVIDREEDQAPPPPIAPAAAPANGCVKPPAASRGSDKGRKRGRVAG
jgi:hypothetical protein